MIGARAFAFGSFTLVPERQLLMRGDGAVCIGGRALDILTALVERPGALISKNDLMARAWPTTTVEGCNLKVNVAALRRALGDDAGAPAYIATVKGRGYRFVAPVEARIGAAPATDRPAQVPASRWTRVRFIDRPEDLLEVIGCRVVVDGAAGVALEETVVRLKPGYVVTRSPA